MNKYLIKYALCALLAVPVMTSCELDQMPEDALGFEQTWSTFERAKKQYVGLQARLRSVSGGACAYVSEIQADLFSAAKNAVSPTKFTAGSLLRNSLTATSCGVITSSW